MPEFPKNLQVNPDSAGQRLDRFLVSQLPEVSRVRVQQLIGEQQVLIDGSPAKASSKLRGGERLTVLGSAQPKPLRAFAEDIPLDIVYEDDDVAVINKPAGMMVHAGAGATEGERNRGTLVNALLHRFARLSEVGGELRPGIVHRLDRHTSGLIVVAKNDLAHRRLAEQFSGREVHKTYMALVHGHIKDDRGTITSAISRDAVRRTRMTTRRSGGRNAVSHWKVLERIDGPYGKFSLLEVTIETGRTHQIRVHLSSLGYPVVGDTLYGAPRELKPVIAPSSARLPSARRGARPDRVPANSSESAPPPSLALARNFLHSAAIEFAHPRSQVTLSLSRPLPPELEEILLQLRPSPNLRPPEAPSRHGAEKRL